MGKIFCVEFQRYPFWNSTQNILPMHWKIWFLYNFEILRALRFKSSYAFLKRPPGRHLSWNYWYSHFVTNVWKQLWLRVKDRAHLSTFKIFIFDKFSCFFVLVVFLVIVQSSEMISVWFCEKMTFFPNFFSCHIFAIYVGGASLGLPTACRLIAVSGARLPSVDGLVVRCIKMHHHVKSAITICLQFI